MSIMIQSEAPALSANEALKAGSPTLSGNLATSLADSSTDHFDEGDAQFLKFHGIYQQDDRDKRKTGKHYEFMVRTKFPGGVLTADQYLVCDDLSERYADRSLRVTTRQDFQFHGVLKTRLRSTIADLNRALMTTLAACGDVHRNVMAPPSPALGLIGDEVLAVAKQLSAAVTPATPAYHELWVDGEQLSGARPSATDFEDRLYGKTYLPRKFKTAFAIPPWNDVDIYSNDLGFVAIQEQGRLVGYNLLAGGGLGMSHGNAQTFPRLADVVGFIRPDQVEAATKATITIHRDFGDRTNRKHARLKYILAERGVDWFRSELERRAGFRLEPARAFQFLHQGDPLGWRQQPDGKWFLGLFIENGRIRDVGELRLKTGLRKTVEATRPEVRLTASQNLLLVNLASDQRPVIDSILAEHGIRPGHSPTRRASMACVSLPTCGLALAESERMLPSLLTRFEALLDELALADTEVIVRMTGCPNGCARPYLAEVGFVGRAPGKYQLYLGGNESGTRLNRLYQESVKEAELLEVLRPLLVRYREGRQVGERFGDWCARSLWA